MPQLELRSLYSIFDDEGWEFNPEHYQKWQQGMTGFPIVDAVFACHGWMEGIELSQSRYLFQLFEQSIGNGLALWSFTFYAAFT